VDEWVDGWTLVRKRNENERGNNNSKLVGALVIETVKSGAFSVFTSVWSESCVAEPRLPLNCWINARHS
jgi:hypothetical protein